MKGILKESSFSGHWVRIKIEGVSPEKLITGALAKGTVMRNIRYEDQTTVYMTVAGASLKKIKSMSRNKYRISVIEEGGANLTLRKLLRRKLLIGGVGVFVLVFFVQSLFIREVKIIGCSRVNEQELRECVREAGLYEGCFRDFDADKVAKKIYADFDEVVWAKVGAIGGYGEVRIAEAQGETEDLSGSVDHGESRGDASNGDEEKRPCNIVAGEDCYIEKVQPFKGESRVKEGDFVKKGGIIISGKVPIESTDYSDDDKKKLMYVHAEGRALARVPYYCAFYAEKGSGKDKLNALVRQWIKKNIPEEAQILNKSLNFVRKENIIKVYGIIETRQQVGIEREITLIDREKAKQ